jgi:hydrogenase maturation protease
MSGSMPILVAGVGNIFLGDDAFGVAVIRRLRDNVRLAGVELVDFGIRGIDLAYALDKFDAAIVLDTVIRGGPAGTLYVLEPRAGEPSDGFEPHRMTPDRVLAWIAAEGAPKRLAIVGCEPATFEPSSDGRLSDPVHRAVDEATCLIESLVQQWQEGDAAHA